MQAVSLRLIYSVLFLSASIWLLSANAVFRSTLDYEGYLASESGVPFDGSVDIEFSIYDSDAGGVPLWTDTRLVAIRRGLFNVELGGVARPFPTGLFEAPIWLGLKVAGDAEISPRKPVSSDGFSFKAQDADILDGRAGAALD